MSKTKIAANVKRYATGRILGTAALALAAVLISGANVKASTLIVTPTNFTLSGWYIDKSSNGTAQISSAQPQSGNASFELAAPANPNPTLSDPNSHDYAILGHTGGYGISFSDLVKGPNNNLSFDYYKSSASTTPTNSAPAYHLYVKTSSNSGFGNQLVWEAAYNSITPTTGSFQTFDIKTGKFWARTKNGSTTTNYDGAEQTKTLDGWLSDGTILNNDTTGTALSGATPFDSSGLIASYSVNIGSGLPGSYKGYVDNVTFGTTTTNFENVAAAPEPSQWAGLGFTAFGALGLILKARKKKSAVSAS